MMETPETQEIPKWLKELEEKREKRLKARLGHEAGAGSPCLTCQEKCPGLDLHFWRKICKNCKCGKESHDIHDDDIYGWAQLQLLGSRPEKPRKIVLPGQNEAVELEWTPKGQNELVESYLKDLPHHLLPIKGSAAAQERKQLLQKQIPLHDIDPGLCHALSENEVKQMNEYIAHVKQDSVGVGHIVKLNLLNRANIYNIPNSQAHLMKDGITTHLSRSETVHLKNSDRTGTLKTQNVLQTLEDLSLNEKKLLDPVEDQQNYVDTLNKIRTKRGDIVEAEKDFEDVRQKAFQNKEMRPAESYLDTSRSKGYSAEIPHYSHKLLHNSQNIQNPVKFNVTDLHPNNINISGSLSQGYPEIEAMNNPLNTLNNASSRDISETLDAQNNPSFLDYRSLHGIPKQQSIADPVSKNCDRNLNEIQEHNMAHTDEVPQLSYENINNLKGVLPKNYACSKYDTFLDNRSPKPIGDVKDIKYPQYSNQSKYSHDNDYYDPDTHKVPISGVPPPGGNNVNFAQTVSSVPLPDSKFPSDTFQLPSDTSYKQSLPIHSNVCGSENLFPPHQQISSQLPPNSQKLGSSKLPHTGNYPPSNKLSAQYPLQKIGGIPNNPITQNLTENFQDPTYVNIGAITDIEYPVNEIRQAKQGYNNEIPREIPIPQDVSETSYSFPECHRCKKMFDDNANVIGIEKTDALWHSECFRCSGCNQKLADWWYFFDKETNDIYCGRDYAKIRGIPRCNACDELIFVKEYCLAENNTFHVKHFCCFQCDEPLAGKNYVMEDGQPLCLPCFEKLKAEHCNTCYNIIKPDQPGVNLKGTHFHADDVCFSCKTCKKPLLGSKLLFRNQVLYCSAACVATV